MKRQIYTAAAVMAGVLLMFGCTKQQEEAPAASQTETEKESEESSRRETEGEETEDGMENDRYHMLQGTVVKTEEDGSAFTLRADDGKEYEISFSDIRDVEAEIAEDIQIAIAYIGEPLGKLEEADLVVALPEQEEWTIFTEEGSTTANAMSSFSMKTADGREISFLKDNCPVEEGALAGDSGDEITVTYVSSEGVNYPVEIKKGEQTEENNG